MINTRPIHDRYMIKLASCMVYQVLYVQCCIVQNFTATDYQNVRQPQQTAFTVPCNCPSVRHASKHEILLLWNSLQRHGQKSATLSLVFQLSQSEGYKFAAFNLTCTLQFSAQCQSQLAIPLYTHLSSQTVSKF
jgi:hypothetical protein